MTAINGRLVEIKSRIQSFDHGQAVTIEQKDKFEKTWFGGAKKSSVTKIVQNADGDVIEFENEKHRGVRNGSGGFDLYAANGNRKLRELFLSEGTVFELQMPDWLNEQNPQESDILTVSVFNIDLLEEIRYSITVGVVEPVSVLGQRLHARQLSIDVTASIGRMRYTQYVNEKREVVKEEMRIGGVIFEHLRCNRNQIPENLGAYSLTLSGQLAVQSPVRVNNMGGAHRIRYRIKLVNGAELDIPATDYQKVFNLADGSMVVDIYPTDPPKGESFSYIGNAPNILKALDSTSLLQSDDESIQKMAEKAIGREKDPAEAVEKIRRYVRRYMSPSNREGYNAIEIAKTRKGNCKEYAILMAAMCRSVGIPANVVSGYLYVGRYHGLKHAFSGHAWVQVYIGEQWYAVDPTRLTMWGLLNDHTVGHIATYIWDGEESETVDIANSLGTFEIISVRQD